MFYLSSNSSKVLWIFYWSILFVTYYLFRFELNGFWRYYGGDFLFSLFMMPVLLKAQYFLKIKKRPQQILLLEAFFYWVFFSFFFESIAPLFSSQITRDFLDCLAYGTGMLVYLGWQKCLKQNS